MGTAPKNGDLALCPACGSAFTRHRKNHVFCQKWCKKNHLRWRKQKFVPVNFSQCLACGKWMLGFLLVRKYCSSSCGKCFRHGHVPLLGRPALEKVCEHIHCRKPFVTVYLEKRFCTERCKFNARIIRKRREQTPEQRSVANRRKLEQFRRNQPEKFMEKRRKRRKRHRQIKQVAKRQERTALAQKLGPISNVPRQISDALDTALWLSRRVPSALTKPQK